MKLQKNNSTLRAIGALGALAIAILAQACGSSSDDAAQCSTNQDCVSILGVATVSEAVCNAGTCQKTTTGPATTGDDGGTNTQACTTNAECTTRNGGNPSVCHESACLNVEAGNVNEVSPNYTKGDPIFIGVMTGRHFSTPDGLVDSPYDDANTDGIRFAESNWDTQDMGGIQVGSVRRPLVAVYCDTLTDPQTAQGCFNHIVNDLHAPVVIMSEDTDVAAVLPTAVATKTLIYCTDCAADGYTADQTQGLLWFDAPDNEVYIPFEQDWIQKVEANVRAAKNIPTGTKVKYAFVTDLGDPWSASFKPNLTLNGQTGAAAMTSDSYLEKDLDFTQDTDWVGLAQSVVAFQPDVILVYNLASTFHLYFMPEVEALWPAGVAKPQYVTGSNEGFPFRFAKSIGGNNDLRKRVTGMIELTADDTNASFNDFVSQFMADPTYGYDPSESTTGYESFNVVAYALTAALTSTTYSAATFSGTDVVTGLKALEAGDPIDMTVADIPTGITTLQTKHGINLTGVNSDLIWNAAGQVQIDSGVYCVIHDPDGSIDFPPIPPWSYSAVSMAPVGEPDLSVCQY